MDPFMISCPGCGTRFSVRTPRALGQTRSCPKCSAPIQIVDPNAPLGPARQLQPWNRIALVGGTVAALLLLVGILVFSHGGAAGSSPPTNEAVADSSDHRQTEEKAATGDLAHTEPAAEPETTAPEQPAAQGTREPVVDALEADLQRAIAEVGAETAAAQPADPPKPGQNKTSPPAHMAAAPTAAERARALREAPRESPKPSRRSLLGPISNPLPEPADGKSASGDAKSAESSKGEQIAGGDAVSNTHAAEDANAGADESDEVYNRLHRKIVLYECEKQPLDYLVEELSELSALEVTLDYVAMDRRHFEFDTPITLELKDTSVAGILSAIVEPLELTFVVTGDRILITTPSEKPEEHDSEGDSKETP